MYIYIYKESSPFPGKDLDMKIYCFPSTPKVFKQSFWMKKWGAMTAKRSVMWSSSKKVGYFRTGKLKRGQGADRAKALVTRYRNARGEKKFQGNKRMAKSSILFWDMNG